MMMDGMIVLICSSVTKKQGQAPHTNAHRSLCTEVLSPLQTQGICGHSPELPDYSSTGPLHQSTMGYPQQDTLFHTQRGNEGVLTAMCSLCPALEQPLAKDLQKIIILGEKLTFSSEKQFLEHFKVEVVN